MYGRFCTQASEERPTCRPAERSTTTDGDGAENPDMDTFLIDMRVYVCSCVQAWCDCGSWAVKRRMSQERSGLWHSQEWAEGENAGTAICALHALLGWRVAGFGTMGNHVRFMGIRGPP